VGIQLGIVGVGSFAQGFIPLFNAHPLVDRVVLCDLDADKLQQNAARHKISDTCPSLDALCDNANIDAVVILTQNWLHAPQAIQALAAGKQVYSAVPAGISLEEIRELVQTVERTGGIYMIGETSFYYPGVIYCRDRYSRGDFGRVVYAEAEYYHDFDHGLYEVYKHRGGENWREIAGGPPMHYPTHSTSQIISVTGAYMTSVSCRGFVDDHTDGLFGDEANRWNNRFSNESALFAMSDGSSCRINEFRRIGHPGAVRMSLFGTEGSFEQSAAGAVWVTRDRDATLNLDDELASSGVRVAAPPEEEDPVSSPPISDAPPGMDFVTAADGTHLGVSSLHDVGRLPPEFLGLPNGHSGSHQFLVDDFVRACADDDKQPPNNVWPNNVWAAARYTIPGIVAHESAEREGELLDVPDFGPAPTPEMRGDRPAFAKGRP
jgi:predicted dehydrogenase